MTPIVLLLSCLSLGVLAARFLRPPIGLAQGLNWWVINIALPALVLELVPRLRLDPQLWFLVISQWGVFAGAWLLFRSLGRRHGWSRARVGCMTLMAGFGNTAFVGYPLLEALRGREILALAVVADQPGCFLALAVGGVIVAALYSGQAAQPREVLRRVLTFPAFIALLAGVGVNLLGGWPVMVDSMLQRIAETLLPLALFSVGLRLRLQLEPGQAAPMALVLGWKLLLAPLLVLGLGLASGVGGAVLSIGVLQAAMAPMVSAAILCDQHHLEPPLAHSILGSGILLSLLTVSAWSLALP